MRSNTRSGDLVARLGGDEFVFILKEIRSSAELDPIIQQLDRALAAPLLSITTEKETYHAAIGVAQYPTDALSMKELLSVADNQMYTHKFSFKEARPGSPQDQNEALLTFLVTNNQTTVSNFVSRHRFFLDHPCFSYLFFLKLVFISLFRKLNPYCPAKGCHFKQY